MLYFDTLPKILTNDQNGNAIVMTNLVTRATLIEKLRSNPMLFYKYTIQDGDTPEIIAEKYYGDPYRYWLVLHANEIMDPLWQWPLTNLQFLDYINSKYKAEATEAGMTPFEYVNTVVKYYEKIITKTNTSSDEINEEVFAISQSEYDSLVVGSQTYEVSNTTCTVTTTKKILSLYDYEYELNESKRTINLLNENYANSFEATFKNLMV